MEDKKGSVDADVIPALWQIGWNWLYLFIGMPIAGIILGIAIGGWLGWLIGGLAFFVGPFVPVAGLIYVHLNKNDVSETGVSEVKPKAAEVARLEGDENQIFTLLTQSGDSLPLLPAPKRNVTTMVVGPSLLLVHDKAIVDLPGLSWQVGQSTQEFYYDQITSVNFEPFDDLDDRIKKREYDEDEDVSVKEGGLFYVNTSDGFGSSWETRDDANEALRAVQDRLREYKTQNVNPTA